MRLAGAAAAFGEARRSLLPRQWTALLEGWLAPARKLLGPAAGKLLAEGRKMTLEEAQACALSPDSDQGRPTCGFQIAPQPMAACGQACEVARSASTAATSAGGGIDLISAWIRRAAVRYAGSVSSS